MKKLLFCAGILALAASCTEEFDTTSIQQEQAKGISFTEVPDVQVPTTKGEFEVETTPGGEQWLPFWTAEKDKINVYAIGVTKDPEDAQTPWSGTAFDTDNKVTYKATRSERYAYFTSANTTDLLDFAAGVDANNPASFLATYPDGVLLGEDATPDWKNGFSFKLTLPALKAEQVQTNTEGKGIYELNAKYAVTSGYPESDKVAAVGENVSLRFNRVLSGMVFRTENVDQYTSEENNLFGKLQSVTLTTLGEGTVEDNEFTAATGNPKEASKLTNGASAFVVVNVAADGTSSLDAEKTDYKTESGATAVTVKLGDATPTGLEWKDANRVYMVLAPVDRTDDAGHAWTEGYSIDYAFEHIDFHVVRSTSNSWPAGSFGSMTPLDIDSYPYLVTKDRNGENTRALIVNSGNFSDIFVDGAATPNATVDWTDSETTTDTHQPYLSEFSTIIVNEGVVLTDEELEMLKQFTSLVDIKLAENTVIPAGTFTQTTLKKINFPKVDEVENSAFASGIKLTDVILPKYAFDDETIAMQILKAESLVNLDMSGVDAMNVGFPSTGFTLDGFENLVTVKVKDGVRLGSNAFYGCVALNTVTGKVELAGSSAFNGCEALKTINILNRDIPANSFNGCSVLENVYYDGKQVIPTNVGLGAFKDCVALKLMDLSQAKDKKDETTTSPAIGNDAFNGCTAFYGGVNEDGKTIVQVGGATIGSNAFAGCTSLVHIEFLEATSLGDGVLNIGTTGDLKQIQLDQIVEFTEDNKADTFGGADLMDDVDLFITPGQAGVDGNELTLNGNATVEFKSIRDKAAN